MGISHPFPLQGQNHQFLFPQSSTSLLFAEIIKRKQNGCFSESEAFMGLRWLSVFKEVPVVVSEKQAHYNDRSTSLICRSVPTMGINRGFCKQYSNHMAVSHRRTTKATSLYVFTGFTCVLGWIHKCVFVIQGPLTEAVEALPVERYRMRLFQQAWKLHGMLQLWFIHPTLILVD